MLLLTHKKTSRNGHYSADQLIGWSRSLRRLVNEQFTVQHLADQHIKGCSHVMWTGATLSSKPQPEMPFSMDKAIDRSPCGTGTSARMAQWFAQGKLKVGDDFIHESIIALFKGKIENDTLGDKIAVVPSIEGSARITGYNSIILDQNDPYVQGFQVL